MSGVLYISYDGMLEPLGQSQVLSYLERLAPGRHIHLISFEKPADWSDIERRRAVTSRIAQAGIQWHPRRYHKRPSAPATAYDIAAGSAAAIWLARRHRLSIIHARSYVGGLMGLAAKRATGAKLLFDMRGFWADERVDGGLWPADGALYRWSKRVEQRLLLAADRVVALTHASERELRRWPYLQERMPPISVIPTCADLERFTIQRPLQHEPFVMGNIGAVAGWYSLDDTIRCFQALQQEVTNARLLVVNRGDHEAIRQRCAQLNLDFGALELVSADHEDIPKLVARMTAGLALYKPAYNRLACAPTKFAEYLGSGVPCLGSADVGDMSDLIEQRRVGVVLEAGSQGSARTAVRSLLSLIDDPDLQQRCRRVALECFSLSGGVAAYDKTYRSMEPECRK